jgi:hypothetical protein
VTTETIAIIPLTSVSERVSSSTLSRGALACRSQGLAGQQRSDTVRQRWWAPLERTHRQGQAKRMCNTLSITLLISLSTRYLALSAKEHWNSNGAPSLLTQLA